MLPDQHELKLGQWLRSDAVGAQGEFDGKVVKLLADGGVHLRDGQGRLWARERAVLSPLPAAKRKGKP